MAGPKDKREAMEMYEKGELKTTLTGERVQDENKAKAIGEEAEKRAKESEEVDDDG